MKKIFDALVDGSVALISRFLPDAYILVLLLTVILFVVSVPVTGIAPAEGITVADRLVNLVYDGWRFLESSWLWDADGSDCGDGNDVCQYRTGSPHHRKDCVYSENSETGTAFSFRSGYGRVFFTVGSRFDCMRGPGTGSGKAGKGNSLSASGSGRLCWKRVLPGRNIRNDCTQCCRRLDIRWGMEYNGNSIS